MVSSKIPTVVAISCLVNAATGFVVQQPTGVKCSPHAMTKDQNVEVSRRVAFAKSAATIASIASVTTGNPGFAFAAKSGPTPAELDRIKEGYERMCYLLDNFEQETTICRVRLFSTYILHNIYIY